MVESIVNMVFNYLQEEDYILVKKHDDSFIISSEDGCLSLPCVKDEFIESLKNEIINKIKSNE